MFPALPHISSNFLSNRSTATGDDSYSTSLSWRFRPVGDQFAEPVRSVLTMMIIVELSLEIGSARGSPQPRSCAHIHGD